MCYNLSSSGGQAVWFAHPWEEELTVHYLSQEIDVTWHEVTEFIKRLPEQERGAFYWNSCAEALFMMTTESRNNSPHLPPD